MIYHCSITSRTGYKAESMHRRFVETLAILTSMIGIGVLILGIGMLARTFS